MDLIQGHPWGARLVEGGNSAARRSSARCGGYTALFEPDSLKAKGNTRPKWTKGDLGGEAYVKMEGHLLARYRSQPRP